MLAHYRLRKILLYAVLELGALMGAPVLPEKLDDLMPAIEQIVTDDSTPDDPAGEKALVPQACANANSIEVCGQTESEGHSL
ncbi:MAG: hypothetical protein WB421_02420 [Terriglobales bacterium]